MRFGQFKITTLFLLVIGLVGLYGCDAGDEPLDELGNLYTGGLSFSEPGSGDQTITIDVVRNLDCDNDNTAVPPDDNPADDLEEFGAVFAVLTLDIDSSVNGLTLESYDIEYIPLSSPLSGGGTVMPPDLEDSFDNGNGTDFFPSGVESSLTFTFMTTQTKAQYVTWWAGAPQNTQLEQARYTFRLTCYFKDDFGVDREMVFERTVFLQNSANC